MAHVKKVFKSKYPVMKLLSKHTSVVSSPLSFFASKAGGLLLVFMLCLAVSARATINVNDFYDFGESDLGAALGKTSNSTTDIGGDQIVGALHATGTPKYSSDVSPQAAKLGSKLSIDLGAENAYFSAGSAITAVDNLGFDGFFKFSTTDVEERGMPFYLGCSGADGIGLIVANGMLKVLFGGVDFLDTGVFVTADTWYYIAVVRSNSNTSVYVNSVEPIDLDSAKKPKPASKLTQVGNIFRGSVDNLRIFTFEEGQFRPSDLQIADDSGSSGK